LAGSPAKAELLETTTDAAAPLRAEDREQNPRQGEDAEEVRLHHLALLGLGHVLERAADGDAGVVHDRVEPAVAAREECAPPHRAASPPR
jgi:hypothetical protein